MLKPTARAGTASQRQVPVILLPPCRFAPCDPHISQLWCSGFCDITVCTVMSAEATCCVWSPMAHNGSSSKHVPTSTMSSGKPFCSLCQFKIWLGTVSWTYTLFIMCIKWWPHCRLFCNLIMFTCVSTRVAAWTRRHKLAKMAHVSANQRRRL